MADPAPGSWVGVGAKAHGRDPGVAEGGGVFLILNELYRQGSSARIADQRRSSRRQRNKKVLTHPPFSFDACLHSSLQCHCTNPPTASDSDWQVDQASSCDGHIELNQLFADSLMRLRIPVSEWPRKDARSPLLSSETTP